MKKILTFLTVIAAALLLTPNQADARSPRCNSHASHTYVSGHTSCGCPIYTKKVFRYYDCYGRPVYSYYRQPVRHRCNHYNNQRRHYNNHSYRRGNSGCNSRHHRSHRRTYSRGGISITYRR